MQSSYELALERLNKPAPMTKLTSPQKKELAGLDSRYAAKIEQCDGRSDRTGIHSKAA
jgi:hypothetical protein